MKELKGKITFIGGGAMGEAIIGSLLRKGLLNPPQTLRFRAGAGPP